MNINTFTFIQKGKISLPLIIVLFCLFSSGALSQKPELILQNAHNTAVLSVAISKDKKLLASSSGANDVRIWDVDSGVMLRSFVAPQISQLAFSPHARLIVADYIPGIGENEIIGIWDVQSGKQIVDARRIASYAFSDDDQAVTICYQPDTGKDDDPAYVSVIKDLTGRNSDRVTKCVNEPVDDHKTNPVTPSATPSDDREMSPNGKTFLTIEDMLSGKGRIIVHDAATGNEINRFEGIAFGAAQGLAIMSGTPYAYSDDSGLLVVGKNDGTLLLWDTLKRQTEHIFEASPVAITRSVTFSAAGKSIRAEARGGSSADFGTGGTTPGVGEYTVVKGADGFELHDAKSGKLLRSMAGFDRYTFSSKQRYFALEREGLVEIWQTYPNVMLKTFKAASEEESISFEDFSPDENIYITRDNFAMYGWDARTGQRKWEKTLGQIYGHPAFSSDSRLVAITAGGTKHSNTSIYYTATGKTHIPVSRPRAGRNEFDGSILDETESDGLCLFSRDSTLFALSKGNSVSIFNLQTYKLIVSFEDTYGAIPMRFSDDKKTLVTENSQGELVFWALNGRKATRLASAFVFADNEWLVATADGLFDGTPGAWKRLIWRFDGNTFSHAPVEAFFNEFFHPGLLQELLQGKPPKLPARDLSKVDIRQPKVGIVATNGILTEDRTVKVTVEVTDNTDKARQTDLTTSSGAQDVRLFRNGSLVKVWHGDVLKGKESVTLEATVPVVAGENNLTAYAFNRDNVKSSDATLMVKGAESLKRKGVAYVVAVGVTEYANRDFDLGVADADADDFSAEFKRQQERLGNFGHVEVITLKNTAATKANILKAISDIAVKIQPEDSLTIFFAGQGIADQNRFYMIPHDIGYTGPRKPIDDAGFKTIFEHGISDEELEAAVEGIDAGQMLLVIDACNSGQALEAEEKRRGPMNSKGLAQIAYEKGMYILTAAQSFQAAKESKLLGHGYLTSALIEDGLKKNLADREPKDGQILLREWLDYATARVPQIQEIEAGRKREFEREKPTMPTKTTMPPKTVAVDNVQRPRVFYRREPEPHPMVVARP